MPYLDFKYNNQTDHSWNDQEFHEVDTQISTKGGRIKNNNALWN